MNVESVPTAIFLVNAENEGALPVNINKLPNLQGTCTTAEMLCGCPAGFRNVAYFETSASDLLILCLVLQHTKSTCDKHSVTGWVLNTTHGSVQGFLEGSEAAVESV